MTRATACVLAVVMAAGGCGWAADWPAFMGADGSGISPETGINKDWARRPPRELWRVPLRDRGYAGPSAADGKVFIIDHAGDQDVVRALDVNTGQQVWQYAYPDTSEHNYGYARATPVFSDGLLYVFSRLGLLTCLDASTGQRRWAMNVSEVFEGAERPAWDYSASPLVDGDRLIILPGGRRGNMACLNKLTGEVIWVGGSRDIVGYATPVIGHCLGRKQYVVPTGKSIIGVDAESGALLWRHPWETSYDVNAARAVVEGDFVFVTSGYNHGCALLWITEQGPVVYWQNRELMAQLHSPVYYQGYLWGNCDSGHMVCLSPQNGRSAWRQPGFNQGGVIAVDGVLISQDGGDGDVVMVKADATSYQELGRFKPLGGRSWTCPIIADGKLIVRNERQMACYDLK